MNDSRTIVRRLYEVIAALDRRRPRPDHTGEAAIARDSATLRESARARLETLEEELSRGGSDLTA